MTDDPKAKGFESLKALIEEARGADKDAALGELARRFEPHILCLARQMLNRQLRVLFGSADIRQSVCLRLVEGLRAGQVQLWTEKEFLKLLRRVTRQVITDKGRYLHAQKRDVGRERPLQGREDDKIPADLADLGAETPSQALREEERKQVLQHFYQEVQRRLQPDEWYLYRRRHLESAEYKVIGDEMGLSPDAVRMRLNRITEDLQKKLADYEEYLTP